MEKAGNVLVVQLPKGTVAFHKDLKKYLDIRTRLFQEREQEKAILNEQIEPKEIVDKVSLQLIDYVQTKLISSLSQYGLYDLTTEDFLLENPGYRAFITAAQRHYKYAVALSDALNGTAAQSRANAAEAASQQITGMGFGVISNDVVAHALYAAQSKAVLERQTAQAQASYHSAVSAINSSTEHMIRSGVADNQKKQFVPEASASIDQIFEYLLSKYCYYLEQAGQFDSTCLSGIDETRSNSVLNNLAFVQDKEATICKAIQLCPFNLAAYQALNKNGYSFLPAHRKLIDYFGLTNDLCGLLIHTYGLNLSDGILENYRKSGPLLKAIAFLKNTDESFAAHEFFENQFYEDLSTYVHLGQIIKAKKSIREGFPEYESVDATAFSDLLLKVLPSYHISDEAVTLYKSLGWDVFGTLSEAFGIEICSLDDADAQIINAWDVEKKDAIVEFFDKKIAEQKALIANKQSNIDKKTQELGIIAILVTIAMAFPFLISILAGSGIGGIAFFLEDFSSFISLLLIWGLGIWGFYWMRKELNKVKKDKSAIDKLYSEIAALEREKAQYL